MAWQTSSPGLLRDHVMAVGLRREKDEGNNENGDSSGSNVVVLGKSHTMERIGIKRDDAGKKVLTTKNGQRQRHESRNPDEQSVSSIACSDEVFEDHPNSGYDILLRLSKTGIEMPNTAAPSNNEASKNQSNKRQILQKVLNLGKTNISKLPFCKSREQSQSQQQGQEEPAVVYYRAQTMDDAEASSTLLRHSNGVPKEITLLPDTRQHSLTLPITPRASPRKGLDHSTDNPEPILRPEEVNLNVNEVKKLRLQVDEYRPATFEVIARSLPICPLLEKLVICRGSSSPMFEHRRRSLEEMHMLFMSLRLIPNLKTLELENFDHIDTHMLAKPLRRSGPVSLESVRLTMKPREIVDERFLMTLSKIPCLCVVEIVSDTAFPFAALLNSMSLEVLRIGVLRPPEEVISPMADSSSLANRENSLVSTKSKKTDRSKRSKKSWDPTGFTYELNSEHVMYLASALEQNTKLATLDLEPLITSFSLKVLACALQANTSVERFYFSFDPLATNSATSGHIPSRHERRLQKLHDKDVETPLIEILEAIEVNNDLKVIRNRCYTQVKVGKRLRDMALEALNENGGSMQEFKFFREDSEFYHAKHELLDHNDTSHEMDGACCNSRGMDRACYEVDATVVVEMLNCNQTNWMPNLLNTNGMDCRKGGWVY